MKFCPLWFSAGLLLGGSVTSCVGSSSPALRDPAGVPSNAAPSTSTIVDPAAGASDSHSASNSATAPPDAPESAADPAGHAPIVGTGSSNGDTPINSGAGSALPERAH